MQGEFSAFHRVFHRSFHKSVHELSDAGSGLLWRADVALIQCGDIIYESGQCAGLLDDQVDVFSGVVAEEDVSAVQVET